MKVGLRSTVLLAALMASLGTARGAVVSYDAAFGPIPVPFPSTPLVSLPLFDPSLGTLVKVTLTLDAETFAGVISWDNEAGVMTDVTLGIGAEVTATGLAGVAATAVPLQTDTGLGIAADDDGAPDFVGADSFTVAGGVGVDSDSDELTGVGVAPYVGLGFFDVFVDAIVSTFVSTTGGFGPIAPVPGVTAGLVTVTYEYITGPIVPEPSTALVVGLGLGAMVIGTRLRRRRAA